jgi:hypothetical protein
MSKIKVKGHDSGTGVVTIEAPNTSTDRTLSLPDSTGTILDENSSLPAANLTGTIADARFPATLPAISGANLTNLPASGVTEADHWRLHSGFTSPNNGVSDITQNWERPDTGGGGGYVGTGMSEAAGVWTFPSTGQYFVQFTIMASSSADARYIKAIINTTTDNSSYSIATEGRGSINTESSWWYTNITASFLFDVTNVSTHKVKFSAGAENNNVSINGNSTGNETYVTFIKLGDT